MEQQIIDKKKEIVKFFLDKDILLTDEFLESLSKEENINQVYELIRKKGVSNLLILNNEIKDILSNGQGFNLNILELEKSKVLAEKKKNTKIYDKFVSYLQEGEGSKIIEKAEKERQTAEEAEKKGIKILFDYREPSGKRNIQDFVALFNARYKALSKILQKRQEMQNLTSIGRIIGKKDRENLSIIGIVSDKRVTKNNNLILQLEDPTGRIKVLVNKNRQELYDQAKDIVLDEVIGVSGVNGENIIFSNSIIWPEVPMSKELKKCPEEIYAVFLSDIHVGSVDFLRDEFLKFLKWIRGELGTDSQKEIAKKVKYIFIVGDFVDGVGIYPGQEGDLNIKDIRLQYEECARLLGQIPEHIQIIACAGNHDAIRISEPQPALTAEFAGALLNLKNMTMISNPAVVNIHASEDFSGFDVLLYHGYSFDYYASNVDGIRNKGGYERADLLMKFLLKRRHLAPTHTSTLYIPDTKQDPLVIETIPDFFVSGHIHYSSVSNYRNITMICGSCWQRKTAFQEKVGHNPQPCRVPIVNLQTRAIKVMKFG
jgi:DNA polymerase II small subunit